MKRYTFETHIPWNGKFSKDGKPIKVLGETYEKAYKQAKMLLPKDFIISHLSKVEPIEADTAPKVAPVSAELRNKLAAASLRIKQSGSYYDIFLAGVPHQSMEDFGFRLQSMNSVLELLDMGVEAWVQSKKSQYRKLVNSKRKKRGLAEFSPIEWYKFQNKA